MIRQQLPQHRDEAVDGVGRSAVGTGQPADRVVGAIHLVAAVDQEERPRLGHRGEAIIMVQMCTTGQAAPPRRSRAAAARAAASRSRRRRVAAVVGMPRRHRPQVRIRGRRLPAARRLGHRLRQRRRTGAGRSARRAAAARSGGTARSQRRPRVLRGSGRHRRCGEPVAPRGPSLRAPAARGRRHPPAGRIAAVRLVALPVRRSRRTVGVHPGDERGGRPGRGRRWAGRATS